MPRRWFAQARWGYDVQIPNSENPSIIARDGMKPLAVDRKIYPRSASHSLTAFSAIVSETACRSEAEELMILSTSAVAASRSRAPASSLVSCSRSVCLHSGEGTTTAFGFWYIAALQRFGRRVFMLCRLVYQAVSLPPKAQTASYRLKRAF